MLRLENFFEEVTEVVIELEVVESVTLSGDIDIHT